MELFSILTTHHLASEKYDEYGIKRLPHPLYSPDLAPCDFSLFGYPKQSLEGQFFDDDLALEVAVSEILMSIEPDVFVRVFAEWKRRLQPCIDQGGDYRSTSRLALLFIRSLRIPPQANGLSAPPVRVIGQIY
jgi:hypothetical protein